jgi:uncharacterized SAM-binding protein YcdF (DUF218 family)
MFFILSKILYFLITPIFWIFTLLVFSIVLKNKHTKVKFGIAAILVLFLFSNNFIFTKVCQLWEVKPVKASTVHEVCQYGVVLGGMSSVNPRTGIIKYSPSIDRLLKAIELYKNGAINKLVITGGSGLVMNQKQKEANDLKNTCLMLGVPNDDLILESESKNTYENAVLTKKIIGTQSKIILITSGFHMRRSAGCFKKQGFNFISYSTDPLPINVIGPDDYFLPKAEPLEKWSLLIKEWIGYITYGFAGYI